MARLGIDIGTTSVAVAVIEQRPARVVATYSCEHYAGTDDGCEHRLDLSKVECLIADVVRQTLRELDGITISSIGVTGQMHGFALLSRDGQPILPAWTWQDASVLQASPSGDSWLDAFVQACGGVEHFASTGTLPAAGYAGPMLYRLAAEGALSDEMRALPIPDAIVAWFVGSVNSVGLSTAASFGLVDVLLKAWDDELLECAAIPRSLLPTIAEHEIVGHVLADRVPEIASVPVASAIGDNQASFMGSVPKSQGAVLLNAGTGAQASCAVQNPCLGGQEIRPLWDDCFLQVEASLCGGTSFAVMARFFADAMACMGCGAPSDLMTVMQELAKEAAPDAGGLKLVPLFDGERGTPEGRGYLGGISSENLTASNICRALVEGVALRLVEMMDALTLCSKPKIIGAGNALVRNGTLVQAVERKSGQSLDFVPYHEAAAVGAALCSIASLEGWCLDEMTAWVSEAQDIDVCP